MHFNVTSFPNRGILHTFHIFQLCALPCNFSNSVLTLLFIFHISHISLVFTLFNIFMIFLSWIIICHFSQNFLLLASLTLFHRTCTSSYPSRSTLFRKLPRHFPINFYIKGGCLRLDTVLIFRVITPTFYYVLISGSSSFSLVKFSLHCNF